MPNSMTNCHSDTIRFQCACCGAVFAEFREFYMHIGEHLRIQAAPLRTLRRTVKQNKIMIASMETPCTSQSRISVPSPTPIPND